MVYKFDHDGIEAWFTKTLEPSRSRVTKKRLAAEAKLERPLKRGSKMIPSNIYPVLKRSLRESSDNLETKKLLSRVLVGFESSAKRMNIYILTGAAWQPDCDADSPIRSLVTDLERHEKPRDEVDIQFIQLGHDFAVGLLLDKLDCGLGLARDIVDTVHFLEPCAANGFRNGGNVYKVLVGPINK